jgi:hypothetical protein
VTGRLAVRDRARAYAALAGLVTRLGGGIARHAEADGDVVELSIPREAYSELRREMTRLGDFRPDREPDDLPPSVRMTLRLGE